MATLFCGFAQTAPQRMEGPLSRDGLATVVGNLPELNPGEHTQLQGRWINHPKHGSQFNAKFVRAAFQRRLRESGATSDQA